LLAQMLFPRLKDFLEDLNVCEIV